MAKSLGSPQDVETYVVPAIDAVKNVIKYRDSDEKSKEIMELASAFYVYICDSISRFYEFVPTNINKFKRDYELVYSEELIDNLFEMILVGSSSPGYSALSTKTWQNVMAALRYLCKFSPKVCKYAVANGVLNIVQTMLSGNTENSLESKTLNENNQGGQEASESAILLLDAILPQKHLISISGKEGESEMERYQLEAEKEKILFAQGNTVEVLGEAVLPRVITIYEESAALSTKFFCLQSIDKLCYLCAPDAISKVLDPQAAALFICDNLSSMESLFVCFGLRLCEVVVQKLTKAQKQYIASLKREGVFELVKQLHNMPFLEKQYGQQADKGWFVPENPYAKHFLSFAAKTEKASPTGKGPTQKPGRSMFGEKAAPLPEPLSYYKFVPSYTSPPPVYGQKSMASQLKFYIFYKSEQLLGEFFENPAMLGGTEELGLAQTIFTSCQKLAMQIDELLKLGIAGTAEQWKDVYQRLAETLVGDAGITNYEIRCTGLVTKLYYSLCLMPTEYVRTMLAPMQEEVKADSEELKANAYKGPQREELVQMVMRHEVFLSLMAKTGHAKSKFGYAYYYT